jgi:hypothetical protein
MSAPHSQLPIIVGGCHRSGTSLVRRILNAHPRIYCGPEIKFFRDFHGHYLDDSLGFARYFSSAKQLLPENEVFAICGRAFIELHQRAAQRADKPRWADKNPENAVYLDDWSRLLGDDWLFVHVVRNPLDTLASISEVGFRGVIPGDLEGRIAFYRRYLSEGRRFAEVHPERYYLLVYERLIAAPQETLNELMTWVGEQATASQVDFNRQMQQAGLEDPKVAATSRIHKWSVGRWRALLTQEEASRIIAVCARDWRRLGGDEFYSLDAALAEGPVAPFAVDDTATELHKLLPAQTRYILADQEEWGLERALVGRTKIPFTESSGVYNGPPADSDAAIAELERLRLGGAKYLVLAQPCFWWLSYYERFAGHLQANYERIHESPRMVVYALSADALLEPSRAAVPDTVTAC